MEAHAGEYHKKELNVKTSRHQPHLQATFSQIPRIRIWPNDYWRRLSPFVALPSSIFVPLGVSKTYTQRSSRDTVLVLPSWTRNEAKLKLFFLSLLQFTDLRKAFICSIKKPLASYWRSEVEESWVLLFDFMTAIMLKGINSKSWSRHMLGKWLPILQL